MSLGTVRPLATIRHGELVLISAGTSPRAKIASLRAARQRTIDEHNIDVRYGVSVPSQGFASVQQAYREAALSLSYTSPSRPIVSLDDLSSLECALIGATATTKAIIASKGNNLRALSTKISPRPSKRSAPSPTPTSTSPKPPNRCTSTPTPCATDSSRSPPKPVTTHAPSQASSSSSASSRSPTPTSSLRLPPTVKRRSADVKELPGRCQARIAETLGKTRSLTVRGTPRSPLRRPGMRGMRA